MGVIGIGKQEMKIHVWPGTHSGDQGNDGW